MEAVRRYWLPIRSARLALSVQATRGVSTTPNTCCLLGCSS